MRVLIDACVLYPTVLREMVAACADAGWCQPLWSDRIIGEWRATAAKRGQADEVEGLIAGMQGRFPQATVAVSAVTQAALRLPDPNDIHVLAAAIDGAADELLTLNIKDFPTNTLSAHGILRRHPDEFLLEAFHAEAAVRANMAEVVDRAMRATGIATPRALLKKARLPRLGKAMAD